MAVRRLTRVLQDIRRAALHDAASLDDGQLLDHFVERQDDAAFAALVQRHSAMVWGVCRRVLAHHHDAEDAFQATFLVLARKAACVRPRALVANWLYGVAHRTALKAKAMVGKRRTREKQVITIPEPVAVQPDPWHNLESLIDQELAALPDKYRVVLLLCDLEGKTGREVARQLKIPEGTLAGRLRTGRLMLAKRLARHGFVLSGGALASVLSKNAASACAPPAVVSITIKTATLVAAGKTVAAGMISAKVAALMEGVLKAMFLTKLKAAMVVLLLIAGLGGTAGLTYQMQAAEQPEAQHSKETPTAPKAADGKQRGKEKLDQAEAKLRQGEAQLWQTKGRLEQAKAELERAMAEFEQLKQEYALTKIRYDLIEKGESDKARHATPNFVVVAATEDFARIIGERAEAERKRLALLWLGQELPRWEQPCLVHVTLARGKKATGFASYAFEEKRRYAPKQEMWLEAKRVQDLMLDVLPQQVMHTLLAHELGAGQPRWIEAGAGFMVQSEQARNERLVALPKALADGKTMPLFRSFELRDYPGPKELETWYSQSLSICQFLVDRKDRATLLAFVQRGMDRGWDDAVKRYYGFADVADLDAAWRKSVNELKVQAVEPKEKTDEGSTKEISALVGYLNDNSRRVQAIRFADVGMDWTMGTQALGMRGRMMAQKPRNFRLKCDCLGKDALDLGSNDQEFWHWSKFDHSRQFHGSYKDLAKGRLGDVLAFPPDWLMEIIGLGEYGPPHRYELRKDAKTLKLVERSCGDAGMPVRKAIVMQRSQTRAPNPQVLAYLLLDDATEEEIASAHILGTQIDRSTGFIVPHRMEFRLAKLKLKLQMTLDTMSVNPEHPRELFTRRALEGVTSSDLAAGKPVGTISVADQQIVINRRSFIIRIPVHIHPGQRDKIKRLALFLSTDKGESWSPIETRFPEEVSAGFKFTAAQDGVYWFSIQIEDKDGRLIPDPESGGDPYPPHLKVQVDTSKKEKEPDIKKSSIQSRTDDYYAAMRRYHGILDRIDRVACY